MDPSRPLWEVHVLNCKSESVGAEACLVFRGHHCIGDCVSLTSLFLDSTTKSSEPESKPTVPAFVASAKTRFSFRRIFLWLWSGILCFLCTFYELTHAIFSLLWMKDAEYFRRGTEVSNHRKVMAHASVDLEDISVVKKAIGGELEDLLKRDGSAGGCGNRFGMWMLPIKAVKRESYLKYCHEARALLVRKKASIEAPFIFSLTAVVARFFGLDRAMFLPSRMCLNTTLAFSNVQRPIEQVRLMDSTVTTIITTVSRDPQALMVHFKSYAGKAKIVALASDNMDPQQFCEDCAGSLQQMREAALRSLASSMT